MTKKTYLLLIGLSFGVVICFAQPPKYDPDPMHKAFNWLSRNAPKCHLPEALRIMNEGQGFYASCALKQRKVPAEEMSNIAIISDGSDNYTYEPEQEMIETTIWRDIYFDKEGDFMRSVMTISEKDCEVLGEAICAALENIEVQYGKPSLPTIKWIITPSESYFELNRVAYKHIYNANGHFLRKE